MFLHKTILSDVSHKSGEYPKTLEAAVALLVKERSDFVPIYTPGDVLNNLEDVARKAEKKGLVEGVEAFLRAEQKINAFKGNVKRMVRGMAAEWQIPYAQAVLLSDDIVSSNPAITSPPDSDFNFMLKPKIFYLGLTGRLLEDKEGIRFEEGLYASMDIYDAFELASSLSPQMIVAVDNHGKQTVVYESNKNIGPVESLGKPKNQVIYVLDERLRELWGHDEVQVLPTNGLKIVYGEFCEKIKTYLEHEGGAMLFGHKYSSAGEFLEMARVLDQHAIWRVCASFQTEYGGLDGPLIDCEKTYPSENRYGERFPEHINRLQLIPGRATIDFERVSLNFDRATAIQALMSLGDVVSDLWFEPVDRRFDLGWDIVYDRVRKIGPDNPVAVLGAGDAAKYPVIKE